MSLTAAGAAGFFVLLAWSGVVAFQRQADAVPLAATQDIASDRPDMGRRPAPSIEWDTTPTRYEEVEVVGIGSTHPQADAGTIHGQVIGQAEVKTDRDGNVIYVDGKPWTGAVFDYRPIVPVRAQTMRTTAYSPDERSCGKWADGITASGKSVWMNGGRLVAADPAVPYGTILTIPGYNNDQPVQVWDRGGKIKGNRLDLLYPTHEIALRWGVQDKRVVFWGFVEPD